MADFTKIRLISDYLENVSGSINVDGNITATTFTGTGSEITNITASSLDFTPQLIANGSVTASTENGTTFEILGDTNIYGQLSASLFSGNGSGLTLIDASQLDFSNVPISSSGLPTGSVYIEDGVLKIVESVN
jgi:hypothetical protein